MTSQKLQRNLFLLAEPTKTIWELDANGNVIKEDDYAKAMNITDTDWTVPARLNTLLFTTDSARLPLRERVRACEPMRLLKRPSLSLNQSIYHKMLVAQPPPKQVEIQFYHSRKDGSNKFKRYGDGNIQATVSNEKGVTFGDLIRVSRVLLGSEHAVDVSKDYLIKVKTSMLWMAGVIFPTCEEAEKAMKCCK